MNETKTVEKGKIVKVRNLTKETKDTGWLKKNVIIQQNFHKKCTLQAT